MVERSDPCDCFEGAAEFCVEVFFIGIQLWLLCKHHPDCVTQHVWVNVICLPKIQCSSPSRCQRVAPSLAAL